MVVQHNLQAMNANRMLGITTSSSAKSIEKLSSGYKINRAADDAAGLSISEKMRRQIRGLTQASANAQDGISAVQTAEGALTEVHDMLQRMDELATKAANGTMSADDRQNVQDEIDQLTTEIDRVSETTKFNEIYLLKGNTDKTSSNRLISAKDAGLAGELAEVSKGNYRFKADDIKTGDTVRIGGTEYNIVDSAKPSDFKAIDGYKGNESDGDVLNTKDGVRYTFVKTGSTTPYGVKATDDGWFKDDDNGATGISKANALTQLYKDGATLTTTSSMGVSKTTTLVGNGLDDTTINTTTYTAPTWAEGDTITDKDGQTYTYYVSADAKIGTASPAGFYKNALDAANAGVKAYTAQAGDAYHIQLTGEESRIGNGGIQTLHDVQNAVKALDKGNKVTIYKNADDVSVKDKGDTYTIGVTTKPDGSKFTADDVANLIKDNTYVKVQADYYYATPGESDKPTDITKQQAYSKMRDELEKANNIGADEDKKSVVQDNGDGTFDIAQSKVSVKDALSFSLHVGADADLTNKIGVNIETMDSAGLGIKGLNVKDDSGAAATYAIDSIEKAIKTVSTQRSALGAVQNRLEHTIKNVDNVVENTTSAESAIRDTDMATEMVTFSKNNILKQAGQSMLAQANQSNQGVLSLLQ